MKHIWCERRDNAQINIRRVGRYDTVYDSTIFVTSKVEAWWDKTTDTLRVECSTYNNAEEDFDWLPAFRTYLDTFKIREDAYRCVVRVADAFEAEIPASIPANDIRTDEEVRAAAQGRQ